MIHTPKPSEERLNEINAKCVIKFTDSSWANDETDSIWNEELQIKVFLPAGIKKTGDSYWNFLIKPVPDEGEYIVCDTIEKTIEYLNKLAIVTLLVDEEPITLLEFVRANIDCLDGEILTVFELDISGVISLGGGATPEVIVSREQDIFCPKPINNQSINTFKNGFCNWHETHFEVVAYFMATVKTPGSIAFEAQELYGHGGLYELAQELTDEFELKNIDKEWDGNYFDAIDKFLTEKENEHHNS
jgi:hypothetical protein